MSPDAGGRRHRVWKWIVGSILAFMLLITAVSYLIESDALRGYVERQMNSVLKGYTIHIGRAFFHPVSLALDLGNLTLVQNANPDPPVATIGRLYASVHWRALLRARLVGDLFLDAPKLHINLKNFREEEKSTVPLQQKGWQEAIASVYPLKINVFRILNGDVTYVDQGPYKPLQLTDVSLSAWNIRNISVPDDVYPSTIQMKARIFDTGRLRMEGTANFLQEPHLGIKANVDVADMELGYFAPITNRFNILVRKGTLSAKGALEYAPRITDVSLNSLDIKGADVDYRHIAETAATERQRIRKMADTAKHLSNEPAMRIRVEAFTLKESRFGYTNKTTTPGYRLFIDHLDMTVKNFSNQFVEGPAILDLKGKFMGTGATRVTGTFRSDTKSPDFEVNVAIENTQMPAMSDLFRTYGDFDIESGLFSFYSELTIKNNRVEGYVKPLFKEMKVYDRRSAEQKGFFHKVYVGLVSGLAKLLENEPRKEVATKTSISGPLQGPRISTLQAIVNLVRNAFITSILPGFEREVNQPEKKK